MVEVTDSSSVSTTEKVSQKCEIFFVSGKCKPKRESSTLTPSIGVEDNKKAQDFNLGNSFWVIPARRRE